MKYAIETKIRQLFKADSSLDDIKVFFVGEPFFILINDYPSIIIFVEQQQPSDEETGIWVYRYTGYIACETFIQDNYEPDNREADIDSVLTIRTLLDNASKILEANLSLGSVVDEGEVVRKIMLDTKVYGLNNRQDNINNRGDFNFLVETQRPRSVI